MCFCIADIENLFNENKGGGARRDIVSIRVMSGSVSGPAQPKRAWKLQEFVAHGAQVNCLALGHKSGRVLVTGGEDKKVNLWAVGKPNCIMSLSGNNTRSILMENVIDELCFRSQHWHRMCEVWLH